MKPRSFKDPNLTLFRGIAEGSPDLVRAALTAGGDPNACAPCGSQYSSLKWPLYFAAERNNVEVVNVLLNAGALVNRRRLNDKATTPGTSLNASLVAHKQGDFLAVARALLEAGADPRLSDAEHNSAAHLLITACRWAPVLTTIADSAIEILSRMFDAGLSVNQVNEKGDSLLRLALWNSGPAAGRIVEHLLERGAIPTMSMVAKTHKQLKTESSEFIRKFADAGLNLDERDTRGRSLLFHVRSAEAVDALIVNGAQVNHLDDLGQNALQSMLSAFEDGEHEFDIDMERSGLSIAIRLVENGIEVDHFDYSGRSVMSQLRDRVNDPFCAQLGRLIGADQARRAMSAIVAARPRLAAGI